MSEFGFKVEQLTDEDTSEKIDEWSVRLPHQCGKWAIVGVYDKFTRLEAIDRMKLFIKEAEEALASLERKREQNG